MKLFYFSNSDRDAYEALYEAMMLSSQGYKGLQLRIASKIFDKLEAIGEQKENGLYTLELIEGDDALHIGLEDAEYTLLKSAFDNTDWAGRGVRKALKALNLLEGAEPHA